MHRPLFTMGLLVWWAVFAVAAAGESPQAEFERQIRPLLQEHCISCHGPDNQEAGLRLDQRFSALAGGDSGRAIVPGEPDRSLLFKRMTAADPADRMPLDRPALSTGQLDLFRAWIAAGANWPEPSPASDSVRSDFWSFRPIVRPPLPAAAARDGSSNPVDRFVAARLSAAGLRPAPAADRRTLIRRLYLDLTGLPPTRIELAQFLADQRPGAWGRLVDRVLASPHFGERWGQHWLDLARYADSDGYEMDYFRPHAWRWRDWVITAFNQDLPFDQFTLDQLAGDLLPNATVDQIVATGFHRNAPTNTENGIDAEEFRVKAVVDRVNTVGAVWLGLTIGCAECHSHKYDPISQREYYELYAYFNDRVDEASIDVPETRFDRERIAAIQAEQRSQVDLLRQRLAEAPPPERPAIERQLKKLNESLLKLKPAAAVLRERSQPRTSHVHLRGNFLQHGPHVTAATPRVLTTAPAAFRGAAPADRLELANWILSAANPLTARVEANRVWQQLFGYGLVRTPDDFGQQGEPPTHPGLLDWLARELSEFGWSRKRLVRLIVTSRTYRQSSRIRPGGANIDPENRWLWRQHRLRLNAETLRDQYLAVSGVLSRQIGGPSFHPPLPAGLAELGFRLAWKTDAVDQQRRRGMYLVIRRNLAVPMLTAFDRPDANVTCSRRESSNTPVQSLTQLNDPEFVAAAKALAQRIVQATQGRQAAGLELLYETCLARPPSPAERQVCGRLLATTTEIYRRDLNAAHALVSTGNMREQVQLACWTVLARTIMNLDEFITRE